MPSSATTRPRAVATEPTLHWSPDGRWLFDIVAKQGRTPLVRVDAQTGAVTEITRGDQAVLDFSITPDARTAVALVSTPVMIGDLFTVAMDDRKGGPQTRITDANKTLWSQLNLTAPEEINYKSFDGLTDSRMDSETARLRSEEEISLDPQHPRRATRRLWLGLRPRISMDGSQGLCGALHQPARLDQLRTGFRQHHSVPLSGR